MERDHGALCPDLGRDGLCEGVKGGLADRGRKPGFAAAPGQGLCQSAELVDGLILAGLGLKQVRRQARDNSRCMFAAFHSLTYC
jgi:hypothetical protein